MYEQLVCKDLGMLGRMGTVGMFMSSGMWEAAHNPVFQNAVTLCNM